MAVFLYQNRIRIKKLAPDIKKTLAINLLKHIMIKFFNKKSKQTYYTGDENVAQGICSSDGRKYLDTG